MSKRYAYLFWNLLFSSAANSDHPHYDSLLLSANIYLSLELLSKHTNCKFISRGVTELPTLLIRGTIAQLCAGERVAIDCAPPGWWWLNLMMLPACARNSQLTLVRLLLKSTTDNNTTLSMPVPKRRKSTGSAPSLKGASTAFWKLLDIDFVFQKSKTILLYGFTPAVIFAGLQMEPRPSFFDLFNIWE